MGSSRKSTVIIDPPIIIPWLSEYEKDNQVVLVDLQPDELSEYITRLDLNVVFKCIPIKRNIHLKADYYIGSSGALVEVAVKNGKITDCTPAATIDVNYSNSAKHVRKSSICLKPSPCSASVTYGPILGNISLDREVETAYSASFSSSERVLAPICMYGTVQWMLTMPRGEKIVSDFLYGNLPLFAECSWSKSPRNGTVMVRPSDISFFDNQKRRVGDLTACAMQYILWRNKIRTPKLDGILLNFMQDGI